MEDELARIREWAQEKLDAQQHIPWDSRRYQHLVTLIDDMLASGRQLEYRTQLLRTQLLTCAGRGAGNVVSLDSARRRAGAAANSLRTSS